MVCHHPIVIPHCRPVGYNHWSNWRKLCHWSPWLKVKVWYHVTLAGYHMTVLLYPLCVFCQAQNKVRISDSLSEGEQTAIASRQEVVKKGLSKLGISCNVVRIH